MRQPEKRTRSDLTTTTYTAEDFGKQTTNPSPSFLGEIDRGSMKIGPSSKAARTAAAVRKLNELLDKATHLTEEQKLARLQALLAFSKAVRADIKRYMDMEEEDVVEEYRRAGKLHNYDEDKEWKKRFARVAKLHPCHWGKQTMAKIEQYTYYLEEDEDDFKIGLYSLIGDEI